jgi:hypothetical protein
LYDLCEVRPFTVADSISEVKLRGSCGLDRVTLRERNSLRVNPDGVVIAVLDVYADWMPKRGSASPAVVIIVPSGYVIEPEWSAFRRCVVVRPSAPCVTRVWASLFLDCDSPNTCVRPSALVRVTLVDAR